MTDDSSSASAHSSPSSESRATRPADGDRTIIIRMWPKTPLLYPMALMALICSLVAHFAGSSDLSSHPFGDDPAEVEQAPISDPALDPADDPLDADEQVRLDRAEILVLPAQAVDDAADAEEEAEVATTPVAPVVIEDAESDEMQKKRVDRNLAVIFLLALFFSLFAICVDLDVRWAIIYTSALVIAVLLLWILNITVGFLPEFLAVLDRTITPMANAKFYMGVFLLWLVLLGMSFLVTRFHYVKVEANEVVVVGGMLERQQRYDTMRMRYTKEIHDVMEYYLPFVRSGRLIISFPEHSEAVIIDNVLNIKKVTKRLDEVVGSIPHSHS